MGVVEIVKLLWLFRWDFVCLLKLLESVEVYLFFVVFSFCKIVDNIGMGMSVGKRVRYILVQVVSNYRRMVDMVLNCWSII